MTIAPHAAIALAGLLLAGLACEPARAAIRCDGDFQIQRDGERIATPYCQDHHLALVAREYGMRESFRAIRYNPSVKARVCRFIGNDNRVKDTCFQYLPEGRCFWC